MKTCPGCGKSCNDTDVYCGFCGFPINNVAPQSQPQAPIQNEPTPTVPPVPTPVAPTPAAPQFNNTQNNNTYQNNQNYQPRPTYQNNQQYNNYSQSVKPLDMRKTDPLAITSLILGICGAVFMCCYFIGTVPAIVGLILGIISVKRTKQANSQYKGHGMALAGLIISAIVTGLCIITIILAIAGLAAAMPFINDNMKDFENNFSNDWSSQSDYFFSWIGSLFTK